MIAPTAPDPRLGPRMLDLLADGVAVDAAIQAAVASTPHIKYRQLGLVDARGASALYTGEAVLDCFGSAAGKHCIAAGNLLGILGQDPTEWLQRDEGAGTGLDAAEIERLIAERAAAKGSKDYGRADAIRAELTGAGIVLEDSADGTLWRRADD